MKEINRMFNQNITKIDQGKVIAIMLTTIDNPFNPHTEWDDWKRFDEDHGYYTSELLARTVNISDELSDSDYLIEIEKTIDRICVLDILGIYKKVIIYDESHTP